MPSVRSFVRGEFRRLSGKDLLNHVVPISSNNYKVVVVEDAGSVTDRISDAMEHIRYMYPQYFAEPVLVEDTIAVIDEVVLDCNKVGKQQAQEKIIISNARIDRCFYGSKRGHRKGCKPKYKDPRYYSRN